MAENLKTLRRRIRSVSNVGKITRAMEMVSAAKLRRAQGVLEAGKPYAARLQELLARLARGTSVSERPLFESREMKKTTLVVFTADRGLCGGFNANLLQRAERYVREHSGEDIEVFCVGRKAHAYMNKRDWTVVDSVLDLSGRLEAEESNALAQRLQDRFLSGETDRVDLLFSAFISSSTFRPTVERFLPLDPDELMQRAEEQEAESDSAVDYILEPSAEAVFDSIVPRYLRSKMYITFAEQFTSEHSARMLAMHNATQNTNELKESLTLRMNKARQAAITSELLDIVGGAEALRG